MAEEDQPPQSAGTILPSGLRGTTALVLLLALVFLVATIADSGLWDPHELRRAELARRIAVHLFGARELVVDPALDVMPTLSDLGGGELPFTSIALGFRLFGLNDWAGRLPLALWAVLGVLVMHGALARLVSPRAGLYAAVALCTMPLYFVQARVMLGDVVTMVAVAMAFFGALGMMLERPPVAAAWGAVSLAGLVSGYLARGLLLGVAVPALAVALTVVVMRGSSSPVPRRPMVVGLIAAVLGGVALWRGTELLLATGFRQTILTRDLGLAIVAAPELDATFDRTLRDLGHALFPWSAFLPFALHRLVARPRDDGHAPWMGAGLVVTVAVAFVAHDLLAPFTRSLPFVATPMLAAIVGLVLADERPQARGAAPLLGLGTVALGFVLLLDLRRLPGKALAPFHVASDAIVSTADDGWLVAASASFLGLAWLCWLDPPGLFTAGDERYGGAIGEPARRWLRERIAGYEEAARGLASVWRGNLAFAFLVLEAGLVGIGGTLVLGRELGWASVAALPRPIARAGLNAWWVLPLALLALPVALDLLRFAYAYLLARLRLPRRAGMAVAAIVGGALLCFGFYGSLSRRLSPKGVYADYAARRGDGERLGVMGAGLTTARYYAAGAPTEELDGPRPATRWLLQGRERRERRWLVLGREALPEMNALFRQTAGINLPVLGAVDGESLLASSELRGAGNDNPLEPYVLASPPAIQHRVEASLGGRIETLGWELRDASGRLASFARAGDRYRITVFHRVVTPVPRRYRAFLHVDGDGRRHNGDHEPLGGLYPTDLWRAGDVIADPYELVLEPHFTPGDYRLYYGLYIGKQRLEVTRGEHRDDRVVAGDFAVR